MKFFKFWKPCQPDLIAELKLDKWAHSGVDQGT